MAVYRVSADTTAAWAASRDSTEVYSSTSVADRAAWALFKSVSSELSFSYPHRLLMTTTAVVGHSPARLQQLEVARILEFASQHQHWGATHVETYCCEHELCRSATHAFANDKQIAGVVASHLFLLWVQEHCVYVQFPHMHLRNVRFVYVFPHKATVM